MTRREKEAVLIASTVVVLALARLIWHFNFVSQKMWQALTIDMVVRYTILAILVLGATYYANKLIKSESKTMNFSLLMIIPPMRRFAENLAVMPTYLFAPTAIAYTVVLTYALPIIAFWEEWAFRGRIDGVLSAIIVTAVFALIHFLVGATLGGSIALVVPGGFFALVYALQGSWADGIIAATYLHIFYDVIAIAYVTYVVRKEKPKLQPDPISTNQ